MPSPSGRMFVIPNGFSDSIRVVGCEGHLTRVWKSGDRPWPLNEGTGGAWMRPGRLRRVRVGLGWTHAARREYGRFGMGSGRKARAWAGLEGCRWEGMALGSLRTEVRSLDGFWVQNEVTGGGWLG